MMGGCNELQGEVLKAKSENKIVEVNFFLCHVLHFPYSAPGCCAGIWYKEGKGGCHIKPFNFLAQ